MFSPSRVLEEKLLKLLEEDVGQGDVTTTLLTPEGTIIETEVVANEGGVLAGLDEALILCESLRLQARLLKRDGSRVKSQTPVLRIIGDARTILSMERTLLNMLSRMSGIATATSDLVRRTPRKTRVACTRKVAPGLGYFDKKAVALGGGDTHRFHLDDLILVKDNHIKIVGDLGKAVRKAHAHASFSKKVEVEVASAEAALQAAKNGADIIMLDNLSPKKVREAVLLLTREEVRENVILEASGRVNQSNIAEYAKTGVDVLSVGEITHSPKALDMSLEVVRVRRG